ncbi:hypothetical protein N24_0971 [Corynebacterium suranareeae]|uniref:Uncharacterized protein n=1 Tax=Corynebacterium suranareeae TaxID=2506452 RepID=A0A160PQH1_9CORY|nr:hypothetical protein N24_0971 [Corynebacterium suranareeae]
MLLSLTTALYSSAESLPPKKWDCWESHRAYNFHLYEGLLSTTTALERLCKLALSAWDYLNLDTFKPVKSFGHNIDKLFKQVDEIDLSALSFNRNSRPITPVKNPSDFTTALVELLTHYSNGPGRYEHLESLSKGTADNKQPLRSVTDHWFKLASSVGKPPDWLIERCAYPETMAEALQNIANTTGADFIEAAVVNRFEFNYGAPLFPDSANVVLRCFEHAHWISNIISIICDEINFSQTTQLFPNRVFPDLSELLVSLRSSPQFWFEYEILFVEDYETTMESVKSFYQNRNETD